MYNLLFMQMEGWRMDIMGENRRDILIKVARMYYVDGLSQEEIAKRINVSRSSISRMLKTCLEEKIVEIRINDTSSMGVYLQNSVKQKYGLDEVLVVPTGFNLEETVINIGKIAAKHLESILKDGMTLGLAWGTTVYYFVQAFKPLRKPEVDVVQLIGGTGSRDIKTDGLELTRSIAEQLNGKCYVFHAPLIVQSKVLKDLLLKEPDIAIHFSRFDKIDIAVVGIGSSNREVDALSKAGYLTPEQSEELIRMGVVGNVCGIHIDINGKLCDVDLNERTVGISLDTLRKVPQVIGIAAGPEKVKPIMASLRGKLIKTLITDESTALALLQNQ